MKQRSIEAQLKGRKKRHRRNIQRSRACDNKRRYRDHSEALAAVRNASENQGHRQIPTRCYECERCGGWHLSSKPKRG